MAADRPGRRFAVPAGFTIGIFFALALAAGPALAEDAPGTPAVDPAPRGQPAPDTRPAAPAADSAAGDPARSKSPGRAVLWSLLVPGGGQVYTGHWWKAAFIAPAELTLAYLSVRDHRAADAARRDGDEDRYATLRDRRNTFLYFTGAALAFSMADAWVSARMYNFDRQMEFSAGPGRAGIRVGF